MAVELSERMEGIEWNRLALVFQRAPLGDRNPAKLQQAFQNSQIRCFVWDASVLVGASRALADGVFHTMIFDVVLLPEYQGRGLGKEIMKFLADRSMAPHILLYAAPGKEGFYSKLGYRKMKTAMTKYLDPEMERRHQQMGHIE